MTKADLVAAVLRRLAVIGAGETPSPEDLDIVSDVYDSVHTQLRKLELAPFVSTTIPTWAERAITKVVAAECGPEFGWSDRAALLAVWNREGRHELAEQCANNERPIEIPGEYF